MSEFQLFSVSVGKGMLALSQCPGRSGDFTRDLDLIRDWRPSFVLSLVTSEELDAMGARSISGDIPSLGARWLHFPISDYGVPRPDQARLWEGFSVKMRAALAGGGRVLVHCKGGCGRSGMAALRLMVEMGEPVNEALSRLRYTRHCAVETDAQFDWAEAGVGVFDADQSALDKMRGRQNAYK